MNDADWSRKVALLAVDGLIMRRLIKEDDSKLAAEIVAEEILVRLSLNDRPEFSN